MWQTRKREMEKPAKIHTAESWGKKLRLNSWPYCKAPVTSLPPVVHFPSLWPLCTSSLVSPSSSWAMLFLPIFAHHLTLFFQILGIYCTFLSIRGDGWVVFILFYWSGKPRHSYGKRRETVCCHRWVICSIQNIPYIQRQGSSQRNQIQSWTFIREKNRNSLLFYW